MRTITKLTNARFSQENEAFTAISLPHTWNALDGQDGGDDYYRGECTYEIVLPNPTPGKRQYIEFGAANHVAKVYCNGNLLGSHEGGFSAFRFELTDFLKEDNNSLTVKVTNEVCDVYPQSADFTFFGGIYRNVYFLEVEKAHFDLMLDGSSGVFVTPYVSGHTRIDYFTSSAENCEVLIELFDADQNTVASKKMPAEKHGYANLFVSDPHLWQGLEDPYCYKAKFSLISEAVVLDTVTTTFGYRSFHVNPENGFYLNGKSVPLHGVCRHQDRQDLGWAISEKEHREDIELIREIGANTIRLAHYQHDQYFYDLCDEIGFAVWAEIPYISRHIFGKAAHDNTISQMKELIAQNYNHPSILFWSISNEISIGGEYEEQYHNLHDLNALCKKMDPSRLTTMAQVAKLDHISPQNQITDLVSYNIYYGWYTGRLEDNATYMDTFHKMYPDKPYGISEYGVDHMLHWHSATPFNHDYTEEYACTYHQYMLKLFSERPYLWATHVWNMFDFAVDRRNEGGTKGRNCKGLITYDRKIKKDTFYIYKAYWTTEPMIHITGRRFLDRAPDERDIKVFTNCDEVTLLLNGEIYQTVKAQDHAAIFHNVPLLDGENTLVAQSGSTKDTITLNGVSEHNTSYDLPDIAAALQIGNWFLEIDNEVDYGKDGYNLDICIEELFASEECLKIINGFIMNSEKLELGEKLHLVGRLPIWRTGPACKKVLPELATFKKHFLKEDFVELENKLHSVKRK